MTGTGRPGRKDRPKRRRRGEELMVPRAELGSYYGRPVIKAPAWSTRDIAGYFFLGGLTGAGSVVAAGAQLTGHGRTATTMKVSSLAAVTLSAAALVHDLGRPAGFTHMLRVLKPTSPMSIGSWLLAAVRIRTGRGRRRTLCHHRPDAARRCRRAARSRRGDVHRRPRGRHGRTRPARNTPRTSLSLRRVGDGCSRGDGAPTRENGPARYTAVLAAAGESLASRAAERRLGVGGRNLPPGAGRCAAALCPPPDRGRRGGCGAPRRPWPAAVGAGLALLAGSACTRFGIFAAGIASAEDPVCTVGPQRGDVTHNAERKEPR